MLVKEIMATNLVTVSPETPLKAAGRAMLAGRISGLPVEEDGRLVGIITEADFVGREAGREGHRMRLLGRLLEGSPEQTLGTTVGDAMTKNVESVPPDATHVEAARRMQHRGIKRLPVVEDGRLVGIVSRADILKAITRPDAAIERELSDDVVQDLLMLDRESVLVRVTEGIVELSGTVPSRTDLLLIEGLANRLDGVIAVESSLECRFDESLVP